MWHSDFKDCRWDKASNGYGMVLANGMLKPADYREVEMRIKTHLALRHLQQSQPV